MQVSFEWLIEPIKPAEFFETYYERQPLLIERNDPSRFAPLLSIAAIDRFLATTSPRHPDVFLVDAARKLSAEDYTLANADTEGSLDLPRVYELYRTGATISLRHLHESMPELAALCRAVEKVFSSHFQTNIYLSPPNAQGFATHFDSHDVFVLQVAGSKIWTLYDTLIELPLHAQGFDKDKHIPGPATRELTIRAGDLFYCPRGLFHSARSTDEPSLHITLGLIGKTWADVLMEAVSAACLSSPAFRANLPAGFANPGFDTRRGQGHVPHAGGAVRPHGRARARSRALRGGLRDLPPPGPLRRLAGGRAARHRSAPTPGLRRALISSAACAKRERAWHFCSDRRGSPSRQPCASR